MCHPQAINHHIEEPRAALRFVTHIFDAGTVAERTQRILQQAWSVKDWVPEQLPQVGAWEEWIEWRDVPLVAKEVVDAENYAIAARQERHRAGSKPSHDAGTGAGVCEPAPVGEDHNHGVLSE